MTHRNFLFFAAVVLAFCMLPGCTFFEGIDVSVTNEGTKPIHNLTFAFTGGNQSFLRLDAGETRKFHIVADGESDLKMSFADPSGSEHAKKIDVYFGKHFRGWIDIRIDSANQITWTEDIK